MACPSNHDRAERARRAIEALGAEDMYGLEATVDPVTALGDFLADAMHALGPASVRHAIERACRHYVAERRESREAEHGPQ